MQLRISRKTLLNELNSISGIVAKKPVVQVLECVKFDVNPNGFIVISATNLEVSSRRRFFTDKYEGEEVSFCVNPRDMVDILKTIKEDEISLLIEEKNTTIVHGKGKVVIPILSADEFPKIEDEQARTEVCVSSKKLSEWLKTCSKFASVEKLVPTICGAYIFVEEGNIGAVATNRNILFSDKEALNEDNIKSDNGVLTIEAISPILNMISVCDEVKISFGERMIMFSTKNAKLSAIKPAGAFPNYKAIITKKQSPIKVEINKEELIDSVIRSLLSANNETQLLKLNFSNGVLDITSENLMFNKKSNEQCSCVVENGEIAIGVKGSYLIDCLSAINGDNVIIEMTGPNMSINMYDKECENKVVLLMPLRIN